VTNLSELLPSGGGAKEFDAVASGTLASGQVVILKSDGKVEAVSTDPASLGTAVSPFGGNQGPTLCKLTDTTFLLTGRDSTNSYNATTAIGTVSNGSISFGTNAAVSAIGATSNVIVPIRLTDNKFIILWTDFNNSNRGKAIVGEVSGGSITYGSAVTFETGQTTLSTVQAGVALTASKFVIVYEDASNSSYGTAIVGDVTGNTITFGTAYVYQTSNSTKSSVVARLTDSKIVLAYSQTTNNSRGRVQVLTISGTTFTPGNAITYDASSVLHFSIVAMSETQFVVSYLDGGSLNYGKSIVCSVSGTTITVGATTEFNVQTKLYAPNSVKINDTQFAVVYSPSNPPNDTDRDVRIGTITAGTITFASAVTFSTGTDSNSVSGITLIGTSDLLLGSDPNATEFPVVDYKLESTNEANFIGITSEAIANGATGKVNPQGGVATAQATSQSNSLGSAELFNAGTTNFSRVVYDSNSNRIVVIFADNSNSNYGTAIVGEVSGSSVQYGTKEVFNTGTSSYMDITFDSNSNRVVIAFTGTPANEYGTAIVGSVDPSDNSIDFGTASVYKSAGCAFNTCTFDSSNNKIVVAYRIYPSPQGIARVGTVDPSDNSISFTGAESVYVNGDVANQSSTFDSSNNKVVITFQDGTNTGRGTAIVGTVSGTGISFGSKVDFSGANNTNYTLPVTFDSNSNKIVVLYSGPASAYLGRAKVGTISGTAITFGSEATFEPSNVVRYKAIAFDSTANKVIIVYDENETDLKYVVGTVSGTDITFETPTIFSTSNGVADGSLDVAYDSSINRSVFAFRDQSNSNQGTSQVLALAGISENLIVGSTYYVQNNGDLSTTSSSVTAGKAISTTQLILNGAS